MESFYRKKKEEKGKVGNVGIKECSTKKCSAALFLIFNLKSFHQEIV